MPLEIIRRSVKALISDPKNARLHSDRNLDAIKRSLVKFGQQKPIVVDQRDQVVAGNGTLRAADELQWEFIDTVVTQLSESDAMAYALADNRTAELAEWDYQSLGDRMRDLDLVGFDLADAGWEPFEAEPLLAAEWEKPAIEEMPKTESEHSESIKMTEVQSSVVQAAIEKWKQLNPEGKDKTDSECLASICVEWMDNADFLQEGPSGWKSSQAS